jgi:hypothetical protein
MHLPDSYHLDSATHTESDLHQMRLLASTLRLRICIQFRCRKIKTTAVARGLKTQVLSACCDEETFVAALKLSASRAVWHADTLLVAVRGSVKVLSAGTTLRIVAPTWNLVHLVHLHAHQEKTLL